MFDENVFLFATNLFVIALCCGIFIIMPRLTRKSYLFGVKIPEEESNCPEAIVMKRRYVHVCLLSAFIILIVCIVQFTVWRDMTVLTTMYLPLAIIPVGFAAYVPNWKKAIRLKEERGWHVSSILSTERSSSKTRGSLLAVPWIWYGVSFVIVVATFIVAIKQYPVLPDLIAGHMDANFQPTRWVEKTWWSVLMMPLLNMATLALMVMVGVFIEKAKLQIDPAKPRLSFAQHRVYRRRLGHSVGFLTLIVILFMTIFGLPILFPDSPIWGAQVFWGGMILISIPIILVIAVQVKTGQGGCKVRIDDAGDNADNQASSPVEANACGRSDDRYWKWGMFYYNPDDPVCIVENRFGTNLGFNYARLPVKISVAFALLGLIAMYVWLTIQIF